LSATQAEQLVLDTDVNRLESDPRAQTMLRAIVESTARGDATLEENQSSGITAGLTFAELAFGYGRRIGQSAWSLGVTANLIFGTTYSSQVTVADFADTDFVEDMFDRDNVLSETRIGIDLGTIYRPSENWSFGLTGTSLNEPTFDLAPGRESAFPSAGTHPGIDAEGRS
jgi:hypothetical protein